MAATVGMCGDLGILDRQWGVIPYQGAFQSADWPMPAFGQWTEPTYGTRVVYPADAPNTPAVETAVTYEEARRLPPDGIFGYEAFEAHVGAALDVREPAHEMDRFPNTAKHYSYFSTERVAKSAAKQMAQAVPGGVTEVRPSTDGWMVALSHQPLDDAIRFEDVIDRLTRIAAQRHGRYNGWERDT
jgi:hypothetical protein